MQTQKPSFLIIGAAKCGTTALASILDNHPDCCMSRPKEVSFFQDSVDFQPNPNYEKGWEWYKQAFRHYGGEALVGEATPSYSDRTRSPQTAQRIYDFNPNMKIIYMTRDPLKRQISGWKMQYAFGIEDSFPDRLEHQWAIKGFNYWMNMQYEAGQWDTCRYGYQLAAYESLFSSKNICVTFLEDWSCNQIYESHRIMTFLDLNPSFLQPRESVKANRASDRLIERPLLRKIRLSHQAQSIVGLFPVGLRKWARENLARTQAPTLEAQISDDIRREFTQYIWDDARGFLARHGKPLAFWPTVASETSVLANL